MMSGTIQRLHSIPEHTPRGTQHTSAIVEIEITVQSISFPESHSDNSDQTSNKTDQYLDTMFSFYNKITDNFHSLLTSLQRSLYETYGCVTIHPRVEGILILRLHYRLDRVVRLQCDQSSGAFTQQLQDVLCTQEMCDSLGVEAMTLTTDLQPYHAV